MLANGGWDLTLIQLTWTIWRAPTNASKWRMGFNPYPANVDNTSKWRMGFNSAFKGLKEQGLRPLLLLLAVCLS